MILIDFNEKFTGFEDKEDILLDTGILLALLNEYDTWHSTVKHLFINHIFNNDKTTFLYINPTMTNEVTHLRDKPLQQYKENHPNEEISEEQAMNASNELIRDIKDLIQLGILKFLGGNEASVLKQLSIFEQVGSADAANISIANEYGTSFLTTDATLARKSKTIEIELESIPKIYYTTAIHMSYKIKRK